MDTHSNGETRMRIDPTMFQAESIRKLPLFFEAYNNSQFVFKSLPIHGLQIITVLHVHKMDPRSPTTIRKTEIMGDLEDWTRVIVESQAGGVMMPTRFTNRERWINLVKGEPIDNIVKDSIIIEEDDNGKATTAATTAATTEPGPEDSSSPVDNSAGDTKPEPS